MKKFPNWDESQDAFTGKPTEMEKLVVAAIDLLGPIPWIRQKPKLGKKEEEKTEKNRKRLNPDPHRISKGNHTKPIRQS